MSMFYSLLNTLSLNRPCILSAAIPSLLEEHCFNFHTVDNLTPCQTGLAAVTECNETTSEHSRDINDESDLTVDGYLQNNVETEVSHQVTADFENTSKHDLYASSIFTTEKQLKIGNFSMLPKDQMQKIYELILQTDNSQSCKEYTVTNTVNCPISQSTHAIKSKSDILKDVTTLAEVTKIDFGFPTFSMPITTIGYCFPQYHSIPTISNSSGIHAVSANINNCDTSNNTLFKSDKTSQCFKGKIDSVVEHAAQTEYKVIKARNSTANVASFTHAESKGHDEIFELKSNIAAAQIKEVTDILVKNEKDCVSNNNSVNTVSKSPSCKMRDVEYTTSLDILVGLLNEIQKITTCQTLITKPTYSSRTNVDHLIEFENVFKKSSTVLKRPNGSAQKEMSITAIEELRQLHSKSSLCSLYLSNNSDVDLMNNLNLNDNIAKPLSVDKEVTVELLSRKELTNTCTEVPSRFFPTSVNHATDISRSLIGILSEPSTPSMLIYGDHTLRASPSLTSLKKIIELPQNLKTKVQIIEETGKISAKFMRASNTTTDRNENKMAAICTTKKFTPNSTHYPIVQTEFDPIMKIKRDLLVTMYSVLVFTVFAALSLPEMLYRS